VRDFRKLVSLIVMFVTKTENSHKYEGLKLLFRLSISNFIIVRPVNRRSNKRMYTQADRRDFILLYNCNQFMQIEYVRVAGLDRPSAGFRLY
jgi:hypothetical protein